MANGKVLTLRPAVVEEAPVVPVAWVCGSAEAPDKMTVKGKNETNIPDTFSSWADYESLVNLLVKTNCMDNAKKIWWDVRPHPFFSTIEIRHATFSHKDKDGRALFTLGPLADAADRLGGCDRVVAILPAPSDGGDAEL